MCGTNLKGGGNVEVPVSITKSNRVKNQVLVGRRKKKGGGVRVGMVGMSIMYVGENGSSLVTGGW